MNAQNALTLTLSRPTGEGTAIGRSLLSPSASHYLRLRLHQPAADDSPSSIGWERAGVRGFSSFTFRQLLFP